MINILVGLTNLIFAMFFSIVTFVGIADLVTSPSFEYSDILPNVFVATFLIFNSWLAVQFLFRKIESKTIRTIGIFFPAFEIAVIYVVLRGVVAGLMNLG